MPIRYVEKPPWAPKTDPEQAYADMLGTLLAAFCAMIFTAIGVGIMLFGYGTLVVAVSTAVGFVPASWFMTPPLKTLLEHRPGR